MFLLTPEQAAFEQKVKAIAEERIRPYAQHIDEHEEFPRTSYEAFKDGGLLKVALPPAYGGLKADTVTLCLMVKTIAQASPSSSLLVFPTAAVIRTIAGAGTPEQQERFFSQMQAGDKMCGFCLTEPNYGSDAGSLQTRAEYDGDDFIINGTKSYITIGEYAHYYLVFVRTGPGKGSRGVSAIVVERDTPGLSFGKKERKMGLWGSVTQEMIFQDARVPAANVLSGVGEGWSVLTNHSNPMRLWGAASMSMGISEAAFEEALAYAKKRVQFKKQIGRFQAVQFMLADMKIRLETVRSFILESARLIDSGKAPFKEIEARVSIAKCYASDMAVQNAIDAVQIFGAAGIERGSRVERLMRDAKAIQIFDGSNQVQRMVVARNILI
jgi:alkylation response protein AidB-like acyl-CoA dehydrogenase